MKFCDAVRDAENKIKWRERVATSVGPQRSLIGAGAGLLVRDHHSSIYLLI